ncbi:A/G-specific adenine glycosylase [Helicobacter burdigaliensis]|uniref:A/G-specific adenine glycosylase n=1 Tax=Helicobacter burdigaliensis TaxID=2315334 RepID=UPI000EF743AE|nr:A/G-specific adenine glycosylase [Helicobacter burdigaliensis]
MLKEELCKLHTTLLSWYEKEGRISLPWRDTTHKERPYRVLISEFMLQQTQVKPVLEKFYFPFLEKFPNLLALSKASEEEVLLAWRGLGYYSRARNLLKCAKITQGKLPQSKKELQKLPGIGAYTAGAIACFGFDESVSFVDSNIKRILLRLFGLPPLSTTQKTLEQKADLILNHKQPFLHNQALLDIGALICTPKAPKCEICPLNSHCIGKANPHIFSLVKKQNYSKEELHLALLIQDGKIALTKSKEKLYFNLYNFPPLLDIPPAKPLFNINHSYTKYHLKVFIYPQTSLNLSNLEFFSKEELDSLPLSSMALKILKELENYSF